MSSSTVEPLKASNEATSRVDELDDRAEYLPRDYYCPEAALTALRQAIDDGWRWLWWYYLEHDPSVESIRDEPEFQAMVAEIKADMAAQLERVRAMEANGVLEPIPDVN